MKDQVTNNRPSARSRRRRRRIERAFLETLEQRRLLSFSAATTYPAGTQAFLMASAEFNGDGRADLVTAGGSNSVTVLLGNGNGSFQPPVAFPTGTNPRAIAVGDFNGDGKIDVVTANGIYQNAVASLTVLLGNGDGTLQAPQGIALPDVLPTGLVDSLPLPQYPTAVAVGDIDADGKLDLAVVTHTSIETGRSQSGYGYDYFYRNDSHVNVLLGHGDGTFADPDVTVSIETFSMAPIAIPLNQNVALADLNRDNRLDVVTTYGRAAVLLGNGDGTLQAPLYSSVQTGNIPSLPLADLDGDDKLDLLLSGLFYSGVGDGTFRNLQSLYGAASPSIVGDVNADGKLDIVSATSQTTYGDYPSYDPITKDSATVLLGHGDGSFSLPITSTLASYAS